jgi:hypothetical protein
VAHEVGEGAAFLAADLLELGAAEAGGEHADEDLAEFQGAGGGDLGECEGRVVGGEEGGEHEEGRRVNH